MKLTSEQVAQYQNDGYIFVSSLFCADEITLLNDRLSVLLEERRPEVLMEINSGSVRSIISPHLRDELFRKLSLHPRLLEPVRQLLNGEIYLHQFKVNTKGAHDGEIWHWHQDFRTWHEDDGMPVPDVINAAVFLNEVNEFNGPMMFVPGSHNYGHIKSDMDLEHVPDYGRLSADASGSPYKNETIDVLINENGIAAPKGPAGSAIFFHGCTIHGSLPNMSPWDRNMVFASLNRVENYIRKPTRPDYLALQDFEALESLNDDCLLTT